MSLNILDFTLEQFQFYILVLFRLSGLFIVAPFFGNASFPVLTRVGLAVFVSLILFPLINTQGIYIPQQLGAFVTVVFLELSMGIVLGLVAGLMFAGIQLGGQLISQQMGITIADVIDPVSNTSLSIIAQYQMLYTSLLFMLLGGPNLLLALFLKTYVEVPIAGFVLTDVASVEIVKPMANEMYVIAIKSGSPTMVALLVATVAMGFIARTVPEMNIFIIGFSIRLGMGLVILWLTIESFSYMFKHFMAEMFKDLEQLLPLMH